MAKTVLLLSPLEHIAYCMQMKSQGVLQSKTNNWHLETGQLQSEPINHTQQSREHTGHQKHLSLISKILSCPHVQCEWVDVYYGGVGIKAAFRSAS